jgi:hypothetical protein
MTDKIFFVIIFIVSIFCAGFSFGICVGYYRGGNDVLADWHRMRDEERPESRP